jgi:hypothetical protein
MPIPDFTETGDLPPRIHPATLHETIERFGAGLPQRRLLAVRLERMYNIARATGHLARFIVFGSFVTAKEIPNDVDVFLLMEDTFRKEEQTGEAGTLFEHEEAQAYFGASVFWLRRLAAFGGEQATLEYWQTKRDKTLRGIVEIIQEPS